MFPGTKTNPHKVPQKPVQLRPRRPNQNKTFPERLAGGSLVSAAAIFCDQPPRTSPEKPPHSHINPVGCSPVRPNLHKHRCRANGNENRLWRTRISARQRSMARKIEGSPAHHGPISRDTHFPIFRTRINTQRILTGGSASTLLHGAWKIIKKQSSPEFLTKTRSKARTTTPPSSF